MITKRHLQLFLLIAANAVFLLSITYAAIHYFNKHQALAEVEKNILAEKAPDPDKVSIDFSKKIANGSPLIFGGVHHPPLYQEDAWNKLKESGVTLIRTDINMENSVPASITLQDYIDNVDDVQNPDNWNRKYIDEKRKIYKKAHTNGMKTLGIISYIPMWLSYSYNYYGVPKDFEVFKDLVKKHYLLYREDLDYVEIWNEPNLNAFLQTTNSGTSKTAAYAEMYAVAVEAIREVDEEMNDGKYVKIGGPASYIPDDTTMLEVILKDDNLRKQTDFVSYHNYEHSDEPSDTEYKSIMKKYGVENLPLFISEWNVTPEMKEANPAILTDKAILYTANKFLYYLKMNVAAAAYHSLKEVKTNSPRGDEGYLAFYRWEDGRAILLPGAKTWHMFSRTLGLGNGPSIIYQGTDDNDYRSIGYKTVSNQNGAIIINNQQEDRIVEITLRGFPDKKEWKRIYIYKLSADSDTKAPIEEYLVQVGNSTLKKKIMLDAESITAVVVSDDVTVIEKVKQKFYSL